MKNTVLQGDALDILPALPAGGYQAVVADPPYFNVLAEDWDRQWPTVDAYLRWTCQWVALRMRALREDGLLFCFGQLGKREHVFLHVQSELCKA